MRPYHPSREGLRDKTVPVRYQLGLRKINLACGFVDLNPLTVGHLRLVSEDGGEKLETFMKKIDVAEP